MPTPPVAHEPYAKTICQTICNPETEQAVTHGPAKPAATTDADVDASVPTSSHDSFMDDSEPPPTTTDFNAHYPAAPPAPSPPAEPEGDDTLRQLHESLSDISHVTYSDDTPSLGSSSEDDGNRNDPYITDSGDTPSLGSSPDDDHYSNGPTTSKIDKPTPTVSVTETNPLHDHPLATPSFTSPLLQAVVRRQIEELEQKAWTSLTDEQRCHQVMVDRFLRYTAKENRQRDQNCGNAVFRRFVISQPSKPIPCYYARAVISHMEWFCCLPPWGSPLLSTQAASGSACGLFTG